MSRTTMAGCSHIHPPDQAIPLGEGRVYGPEARDLVIITYGNGVFLSLRAAKTLYDQEGIEVRILDLRWLNPLNTELIAGNADDCGRVLIVDEGRRTGGIAEGVITTMMERCKTRPVVQRVTGEDTYIPLGPAANLILPSEDDIIVAIRRILKKDVG